MGKIKTLILRAPGTNCDMETAFAFQQAGATVESVHINRLTHGEKHLGDYQIMVIPGGFTYGDDIAAGTVLANELRLKLGEDVRRFVEQGKLILGICNGFQVLVKAGILPEPAENGSHRLTLATNDSNKFECRWAYLKVNQESPCIFTQGIDRMYLPIAHAEGKVVTDSRALPTLNTALYYTDEQGNSDAGYPYNPTPTARRITSPASVISQGASLP